MPPKNRGKTVFRGVNAPENIFQRHLLDLIRPNPGITYDILAKETGRDRKTVRRHIGILKQKGLLKRHGPAKGGHWEVVE
ncbi:MAG: winged helix-turn-helix domain-containing protein [Nitrospina sp.]|nr:winged helix-turn-helix domain-containing protein [Nitrospina sp.]